MLSQIYPRMIDKVGNWNPQLFREVKGRLNNKNVAIVAFASIIGQGLLYLYFNSLLPTVETRYDRRYCASVDFEKYSQTYGKCTQDLLGNVQLIKELWWLDLFTTMSIIGIFVLLVVGSYMLMADITKEKSRETLNFLRLTPQSAMTILSGKMLGVPVLVYLFGILAIPLHLIAGLNANISFPLILAFYGVLVASCVFFYTASLLFSLVFTGLGSFQAWLGSLIVFFFVMTMMGVCLEGNQWTETSFDWVILFYPGNFLAYLVKSTFLSPKTINYLSMDGLDSVSWYGNYLWHSPIGGFMFAIANYSIATFCLVQGIKRRFHSPKDVVITKVHSYIVTTIYVVVSFGFTLQSLYHRSYNDESLVVLFILNFIFAVLLVGALTPQRQTLHDWARFRHENKQRMSGMKDLLVGDKSPAITAIVVNMMIMTLYVLPALWLLPDFEQKIGLSLVLLLSASIIVIYATIYQLTLMLKTKKRNYVATATITGLVFSPALVMVFLGGNHTFLPNLALFSALPFVGLHDLSNATFMGTLITQFTMIVMANYQLKRVLKKAGISETKALLNS